MKRTSKKSPAGEEHLGVNIIGACGLSNGSHYLETRYLRYKALNPTEKIEIVRKIRLVVLLRRPPGRHPARDSALDKGRNIIRLTTSTLPTKTINWKPEAGRTIRKVRNRRRKMKMWHLTEWTSFPSSKVAPYQARVNICSNVISGSVFLAVSYYW